MILTFKIFFLLRAIQAAIDLAAHIIADKGLGLPGSLREHFTVLKRAGVIEQDLAEKWKPWWDSGILLSMSIRT